MTRHLAITYRSGLEEKIAGQIAAAGVTVSFETVALPYVVPESKHRYTPDFTLPNGIIIETKGLFESSDRKKMKLIKEQHPDLDIRFVFSNAHKPIAKQSKTTYAKWCDTLGFKWAHKDIPPSWLTEPSNLTSLRALKQVGISKRPS